MMVAEALRTSRLKADKAAETRAWLSRCYFSDTDTCNATHGLDGTYQTKWYHEWDSGERGPNDLVFYRKTNTRYRNLCGRCYAEYGGHEENPGWRNKKGELIPFFIDSPPEERWQWPVEVLS